jgi:O-antigen chain-terminating methyltransferase
LDETLTRLTDLEGNLSAAIVGKADQHELAAKADRAALDETLAGLTDLQGNLSAAIASKADQQELEAKADRSTLDAILARLTDLQRNLLNQERRLSLLLEEARKRLPEPMGQDQVAAMVAERDHWLESYYAAFEDVFRGTREDIKHRAEVYLPVLRSAGVGSDDWHVIDLGCGRGEWLELLRDHGIPGRGIDHNRIMIDQCRQIGLEVEEADIIDYVTGLPSASVGAVTGMHIIEHIPFDGLVRLIDESLRVLRPGGVVIFETPNPENLLVGACHFYYDPTHLHPLPPPVAQFLLEARGFVRVEILRLTANRAHNELPLLPEEHPGAAIINKTIESLNQWFGAAPDYAVIGYKA